jgi:beta-lactamase regulating signal transducer with metallopeptidase domain/5-hydroxyisourate hydrolase-like protein (transthyretin family)
VLPAADPPPAPAPAFADYVVGAILTAYAAIVAGLAVWSLTGLILLLRLYRSTYPVPPEVIDLFDRIAGPDGASVRLLASDRLELPIAFALWRPVIVLPGAMCRARDSLALRYSLAHEWSHVENGDVWRWGLTTVVQFLYFYNPVFWWLRRHLRLCQDYLADARAAAQADETADYAEFLVGLSGRRQATPAAALGIGDRRSNLYRRIVMLLQTRANLERRCLKPWTVGCAAAAVVVLALCSAVRLDAQDPPAKTKETPKVTKEAAKEEKGETLRYSGRVVDKDTGKPVAGATVTVRRSLLGDPELKEQNPVVQETKHKTDADGKYHFVIPPEQSSKRYLYIELDVEHPDYAPRKNFGYALSMIRKNEKVGERGFFEHVEIRAGKAITGTLQTTDGKPASGVRVLAYSVTNQRGQQFEYGSFADNITDAKGHFRIVVTTPGNAVFWILPEKYMPSLHRVKDDKRGDLGTFTLHDGPRLKGKVLDVRGKPLAGVNVNANSQGRPDELQGLMVADAINRSAVTNDKGEFTMGPLPPGEYQVQPDDHAREGTSRKRFPLPDVFVGQKVTIQPGAAPAALEVRAVPSVILEGQYVDSKGKPTRGHGGFLFGRFDNGFWHREIKPDANGKMTARVPHGLEGARLQLMTNEHGALRFRKAKDEKLEFGRDLDLGTLLADVKGIEVVACKAPVVVVKVTAKDGAKSLKSAISARYTSRKGKPEIFPLVNGPYTDVIFNRQDDGRFRTSQLQADEEITIKVIAEGYKDGTVTVRLPEGETREVEVVLEKK